MNFNVSLSKKIYLAAFLLLELLVAIGCEGRELARKDSPQNSASSNVWKSSCNISSIDNTTNSTTIPCKNGTIEWLNPEGSKTLHFYQNGQMFRLCLSLREVLENARVSLFLVGTSKYNITPIVQSDPSVPTCFWSHCGHVKITLNATSNENPLTATQDSFNLKYNMYAAHDGCEECSLCTSEYVVIGKVLNSTRIGNLYKHSVYVKHPHLEYLKYNNVSNYLSIPRQECEVDVSNDDTVDSHLNATLGVDPTPQFFEAWTNWALEVGVKHFLAGNSRNVTQKHLSVSVTCLNTEYKEEWMDYADLLADSKCCRYANN